eukprot:3034086-Amphidinium_carterae.1
MMWDTRKTASQGDFGQDGEEECSKNESAMDQWRQANTPRSEVVTATLARQAKKGDTGAQLRDQLVHVLLLLLLLLLLKQNCHYNPRPVQSAIEAADKRTAHYISHPNSG